MSRTTSGKQLLDRVDHCVEDLVEGLLLTNPHLLKIDGHNAVVRLDINAIRDQEVTLVSGGGSGHEPAHAGYIGAGMLSAAVLGNVFASPSVASILATIRVVGGKKGVLLIVKNYTGDRLNFGMALEMARQEGIDCKMVVVDDDCALPEGKGITGGRGIAGTCLVHKIAGALANQGKSLQEIFDLVQAAIKSIHTMGIALTTCTLPGSTPSTRLAGEKAIEIGMGIHGEAGREQANLPSENPASFVAKVLVESVLGRLSITSTDKPVLLINNLGTLPVLEVMIVTKNIVQILNKHNIHPARIFVGSFMTSLEMNGISLSILKIESDSSMLELVDYPTTAPAWIVAQAFTQEDFDTSKRTISSSSSSSSLNKDTVVSKFRTKASVIVVLTETICRKIVELEPLLTQYDGICGDGDCGIVMKKGAEKILSELESFPRGDEPIDVASFCEQIANGLGHSMGGTSGVLLELCFRSMVNYFLQKSEGVQNILETSSIDWSLSLQEGVKAIQYYGGGAVGMRTMLDAFVPAVQVLVDGGSIVFASAKAKDGMESTKTMLSLAGRSNYVSADVMNGTPDPGAFAVAAAFEVISNSIGK